MEKISNTFSEKYFQNFDRIFSQNISDFILFLFNKQKLKDRKNQSSHSNNTETMSSTAFINTNWILRPEFNKNVLDDYNNKLIKTREKLWTVSRNRTLVHRHQILNLCGKYDTVCSLLRNAYRSILKLHIQYENLKSDVESNSDVNNHIYIYRNEILRNESKDVTTLFIKISESTSDLLEVLNTLSKIEIITKDDTTELQNIISFVKAQRNLMLLD